jgi:methyl-accepting chemotaxis protein
MKLNVTLNVTKKILVGYVVGFISLVAFAALTLFNGQKIEATTIALAQEKIPSLIAAASLKSNVQMQGNQLYELYATNDQTKFTAKHAQAKAAMQLEIAKLSSLAEYKTYEADLAAMATKQDVLTNQFVKIMREPEVNWDAAREALAAFSKSANEMGAALDALVKTVADETLASANTSQQLTEQLINVALILAGFTFIGVLAMAYFSHRTVAVPLREISDTLSGIAARKDLTQRIKQHSDDEVGAIAQASNNLLEEFQKLARTLNGTAQEVNRTTNNLNEVTEGARVNMADRNAKLRQATQDFMSEIETSTKANHAVKEVDMDLHRAQMKFIQRHLSEIDEGQQITERNERALQTATTKLQKLVENMHGQIRLLNF